MATNRHVKLHLIIGVVWLHLPEVPLHSGAPQHDATGSSREGEGRERGGEGRGGEGRRGEERRGEERGGEERGGEGEVNTRQHKCDSYRCFMNGSILYDTCH